VIPVGITGLLVEHTFRTVLGRPIPAAIFLIVNGVILYAAVRLRRRATSHPPSALDHDRRRDEHDQSLCVGRAMTAAGGPARIHPRPLVMGLAR
jgi:undecaprenyl pyrophosphate phosphatase UppP